MRAHRDECRIARLCAALGVSRGGYYGWCRRPESARAQANRHLVKRMRQLHQQTREAYGTRRIWHLLRRDGVACGRHRVARLRRAHGIRTRRVRRFQRTTQSRHSEPVAPNRLAQMGEPDRPDQVWAGDITGIPTQGGWLYLAVLLDLYSRRVVGWGMSDRLKQDLVLEALTMALGRRRPSRGLVHHTDQGRQYASAVYQAHLAQQGLVPSMSRKGHCYDNATVESFFSTLKNGLVHHQTLRTLTEARVALFDYIEMFYNTRRLHQSLGYRSPAEYETMHPAP